LFLVVNRDCCGSAIGTQVSEELELATSSSDSVCWFLGVLARSQFNLSCHLIYSDNECRGLHQNDVVLVRLAATTEILHVVDIPEGSDAQPPTCLTEHRSLLTLAKGGSSNKKRELESPALLPYASIISEEAAMA
jgi:hypothetical protein